MIHFNNIKAVVFDLDGTLYEDTHHFTYYAEQLKKRTPLEFHQAFEQDYKSVLEGTHTLKIGRVYDAEKDLILVQDNHVVKEAYRWNGGRLSSEEVAALYPEKISFDMEKMFNVGDLWWVPNSIGRHYSLTSEDSHEAFIDTRVYMTTPQFQMTKVEPLNELLYQLKESIQLVLLTNSPEEDSMVIIEKLGLHNAFHYKIFNGKKPSLTKERFLTIKDHTGVNFYEILSIGDNYINEIQPAKELGCATVLIDPHQISHEEDADYIVPNIAGVVPILSQLKK